jgi:hypothetical protein
MPLAGSSPVHPAEVTFEGGASLRCASPLELPLAAARVRAGRAALLRSAGERRGAREGLAGSASRTVNGTFAQARHGRRLVRPRCRLGARGDGRPSSAPHGADRPAAAPRRERTGGLAWRYHLRCDGMESSRACSVGCSRFLGVRRDRDHARRCRLRSPRSRLRTVRQQPRLRLLQRQELALREHDPAAVPRRAPVGVLVCRRPDQRDHVLFRVQWRWTRWHMELHPSGGR